MDHVIKKMLSCCLPAFRMAKNWGSGKSDVVVLTFHDIPDSKLESFKNFIHDLKKDFNFISPLEFQKSFQDKKSLKKNSILLTFDDGFKSSFEASQKVLKPLNIKAAFFVCPGFFKENINIPEFVADNLHLGEIDKKIVASYQYPMSIKDAKQLEEEGNLIGCHSFSHANLASLTKEKDREYEIVESKKTLETIFQIKIKWFAYPFGELKHIDKDSLRLIAENYEFCFSNVRGVNIFPFNKFAIKRQNIDIHKPLSDQLYIAYNGLNFIYSKKAKKLEEMVKNLQ